MPHCKQRREGILTVSTQGVATFVLHPAITELMNIIEIVLRMALTLASSSSASGIGQARIPAVVRTDGQKDIAAVRADEAREELSSPLNVKVDIVTAKKGRLNGEQCKYRERIGSLSVGSTTTVFGSELHETSLTVTAGSGWVARGFLHSERGEHNALDYSKFLNIAHNLWGEWDLRPY